MEIKALKGIGPKTSKLMEKLNILTVSDLLTYYPFRFQIYNVIPLNDAIDNTDITIKSIIESEPKVSFIRRNFNRLSFRALSGEQVINVVIFNRAFMKNHLTIGRSILLYGKFNSKKNSFVASDIKFDMNTLIEPIYHLTSGISNKDISRLMKNALDLKIDVEDFIPKFINQKYNFITKNEAIKTIHFPASLLELKKAKLKLIYEELFIFMFKIAYLRIKNKMGDGIQRNIELERVEEFISKLPFTLTSDQNVALKDIYKDLNGSQKMNRLLLGDVGSGKTIVAITAMYINHLATFQSALMVPTEILATQHYYAIRDMFKEYNLTVELLIGSMTKKEKENIVERLSNGSIDIIIGTHALISEKIEFQNLGLVITDEQHRFGVNQRKFLTSKGVTPDILYLSATPIPRTFAKVLYGDMSTSFIKTKPDGRKDIKTHVKSDSEIKEVLARMLEEIKKGHQIYVVAPVIEESENFLNDVNKLKTKIDTAFNNKVITAVIHGKIKSSERTAIMNDFQNNKISILISTTVIEVGIDVKNATMMVIFDADRFGLATLHQLRGRIGRSDLESTCFLICNKEVERLKVLESSNDGFYISEKDFEMRGEGDIFGLKQSGDMNFKLANLKRDYKILSKAKEDVEEYIKNHNYKNDILYKEVLEKANFVD